MRIDCIANISETLAHDVAGKTVFVMDVLRATSTMTAALSQGAEAIIPTETVAQAKSACSDGDLLTGERQGKKIPGFDLGNSPMEYTESAVKGRRIVMTTTNGTRGIQKASKAYAVLAGSMLNAKACAYAALQLKKDVVLICAGTKDVFALEDGLCAGMILHEIRKLAPKSYKADDLAVAMEGAYRFYADRMTETLLSCDSGIRLASLGYTDDVIFCAQQNTHSVVPALSSGAMRPFEFK